MMLAGPKATVSPEKTNIFPPVAAAKLPVSDRLISRIVTKLESPPLLMMLRLPVKYPVFDAWIKPKRLDIVILLKEKIPLTSVVALADPPETEAPCTGTPSWSITRPWTLAVTITSGGILLPTVVELLVEAYFWQPKRPAERIAMITNRDTIGFFTGFRLGYQDRPWPVCASNNVRAPPKIIPLRVKVLHP